MLVTVSEGQDQSVNDLWVGDILQSIERRDPHRGVLVTDSGQQRLDRSRIANLSQRADDRAAAGAVWVVQLGDQSFQRDSAIVCGLGEVARRHGAQDLLFIAYRLPAARIQRLGGAPADFAVRVAQSIDQGNRRPIVLGSAQRLHHHFANLAVRVSEHCQKEFQLLLLLPFGDVFQSFAPDSRYLGFELLQHRPVHGVGWRGRRQASLSERLACLWPRNGCRSY